MKSGKCLPKLYLFDEGIEMDTIPYDADEWIGYTESEKTVAQAMYNSTMQTKYLNLYVSNLVDERLSVGQ